MDIQIVSDPSLGQKIDYIKLSHPAPWRMSVGNINGVKIEGGVLRVNFTLQESQAKLSSRWNRTGILLEVFDADNRVVLDGWVDMKNKPVITGNLCLRDPNAV